ncbi:MAG TPA: ammonium transporter, partial [Solirubrobacterales bacterium]|nr:ammonium transporter [Solirubrobacterales bacterium]
MRRRHLWAVLPIGLLALLALPSMALGAADPATQIQNLKGSLGETDDALNTTWLIVAAVLVMFMQAGFLLLEVGFSRMKNVGAGVAKVLVNFSIASICYWAVGFALAFGGSGEIWGDS